MVSSGREFLAKLDLVVLKGGDRKLLQRSSKKALRKDETYGIFLFSDIVIVRAPGRAPLSHAPFRSPSRGASASGSPRRPTASSARAPSRRCR